MIRVDCTGSQRCQQSSQAVARYAAVVSALNRFHDTGLQMSKAWKDTWLTLIVVAVFVPVAALSGSCLHFATSRPLHPSPKDVPT